MEQAVKIAAAANVKLVTRSRWSVNVVSGISHTIKENDISDLLIGLHQKTRLSESFYGKLTNDLVAAVEQHVFVYRPVIPLNTVMRLHLVVPRKAEFEPGFAAWAKRVALLATQLSCSVETYSGRGTLEALQQTWDRQHFNVRAERHVYNEWHNFISIAHNAKEAHMVIFVVSRRGTLSYHHYMEHLPDQLERYFSSHNTLLLFPAQPASVAGSASMRGGVPMKVR